MSFGKERISLRGRGSAASPAWGRLVTNMASGTVWGRRLRLLGVSQQTWIRSSMKPSTFPRLIGGTRTAIGRADEQGASESTR